ILRVHYFCFTIFRIYDKFIQIITGVNAMKVDTIKVLMIEDSLGDGQYISTIMKEEDWIDIHVEQAFRLSSGIDKLKKGQYDVILLDLTLPDSFGIETVKKLLAEVSDVPVVIMTGLEDEELGMKAVQLGAQDFLVKLQIDGKTLVRSMVYAMARKQAVKS
ncbi:MAG: response regulator, partial [Bacteroidota bacterium]|nr:response regulator [Bacteroidota bacterium]